MTTEKSVLTAVLTAAMNSFALDYVARQSVGGTHLNFFILEQLPVPTPEAFAADCAWSPGISLAQWIVPRVLELTYTAIDLEGFARDLGYDGPPFAWDDERRFWLRCELDAAFFHIYGIERDDVDYILETFPIVKRKDVAAHGEYRTKRVILELYDEMVDAYTTRLDPPAADGWCPPPPRLENFVEVDPAPGQAVKKKKTAAKGPVDPALKSLFEDENA